MSNAANNAYGKICANLENYVHVLICINLLDNSFLCIDTEGNT